MMTKRITMMRIRVLTSGHRLTGRLLAAQQVSPQGHSGALAADVLLLLDCGVSELEVDVVVPAIEMAIACRAATVLLV